jgi:hypothetical protein
MKAVPRARAACTSRTTARTPSTSRPESISSSTARRGCSSASCSSSLRLRSPPEKPSLTARPSIASGSPGAWRRTRALAQEVEGVERRLAARSRTALSAVRMNRLFLTPGISGGAWNDRKSPARARASGLSASRSWPAKRAWPPVTR